MQPTRRALRLTAVLASAGAVAGCSALASTATATPSASVSPGPTSTYVQMAALPTSAPPGLSNTGTNLPSVVTSLITYGQWLIGNPDPDKVATIAVPGCAAANQLIAETQSLIDQDAYVVTAAATVTGARWPSPSPSASAAPFGDQAVVDIQVSRPREAVTPRNPGKQTQVLAYLPELRATTVRVSLIRGTDKKWRLCEVTTPLDGSRADSIAAVL